MWSWPGKSSDCTRPVLEQLMSLGRVLGVHARARTGRAGSRAAVRIRSCHAGRPARYPAACRRDQRAKVRRRAAARMLDRRLGARHADQRRGCLSDQPRGRADDARATVRRRRPAGDRGQRRLGAGPLAVAGAFRHARLRRQQGGRPRDDARRPRRGMPRTGSGSTCWSPA